MAYRLNEVTLRVDDPLRDGQRVRELWDDVASGKLPLLFDSRGNFLPGVSPVSRYSGYRDGGYDLTVLGMTADFFRQMEEEVRAGRYRKYHTSGQAGPEEQARAAWEMARQEENSGQFKRAFAADYESAVPARYAKDGKAHCYLYLSVLP